MRYDQRPGFGSEQGQRLETNRQEVNQYETNNRRAKRQELNGDRERLQRRSRREFLTAATGLTGGTALLLGGLAWFSQPNHVLFPGGTAACPTTTATASTLSQENPEELTVCQGSTSITFFPFYVAQRKGYFLAQGLKISNPAILQVGSKVVAAVEADKYQIGNGVITDAFSWSRTDASARIFGAFINTYTVDIVVGNKFRDETNITANSSLNERISALKGKTIGITGPGSATQGLLTYLFKQIGLDAAKNTRQISLGSSTATALNALQSGQVDVLSFLPPIGQTVKAKNVGDIWISPMRGDIPGLRGDVHGVFYTKQSTIDARPAAIAAYIRAISQAEAYIQNNPTETKILLNDYLGLGQTITDAVYAAAAPDIARSPQITQSAYNVAGQFHVNAGLVTIIPSYSLLVASNTIDKAIGVNTACQL